MGDAIQRPYVSSVRIHDHQMLVDSAIQAIRGERFICTNAQERRMGLRRTKTCRSTVETDGAADHVKLASSSESIG
jgi:hypothetical protein